MENNDTQPAQEHKKGISPILIFGLFALIAAIAAFGFILKANSQKSPANSTQAESTSTQPQEVTGPVKEFTVFGKSYGFEPSTITVNHGDTVKITFRDSDGSHNLIVDGYNVATDTIGAGGVDTITFKVDKAGSFKYYCSVANHEALGMTGTLVVQ